MPLPKKATKKQRSKKRLERYHARQKAIEYWGEENVKGMDVHHRNGDGTDNRKKNMRLKPNNEHGRKHGRGISSSLPLKKKVKIKLKRMRKKL